LPPDGLVFIVESEREVGSLESIGLAGVTSADGERSPRMTDWTPLAGRDCVVWGDNDEAGRLYAEAVAGILSALNPPAKVRIISPPKDLGEGGGIEDWLANCRDAQAPNDQAAEVRRMAEAAPIWRRTAGGEPARAHHSPMTAREMLAKYPTLREPVIDGLLRRGELMNLIAAPKTGKSWLALDLALAVATGRRWMAFDTTPGKVLLLDNELHGETLTDRLRRVVGDRKIPLEDYGDRLIMDTCRGKGLDIFALKEYFGDVAPETYRLIIVDAFYRFLPVNTDENSNADLTSLYNELDTLAERLQASFVLIHHSTKGAQAGKSIVDVGAGAGAMSRATDTHVILRQHQEEHAVVLEAAVRSFAPVGKVCLRWKFPVWEVAPELDPEQLAGGRQKKAVVPADAENMKRARITPEDFVERFITGKPRGKDEIISEAVDAGVSGCKARMLFSAAKTRGLIHKWRNPQDRREVAFATVPQPSLIPESNR